VRVRVRVYSAVFTASQTLSPLLPVALRTGEQNASKRLSKAHIFCVDAKRIAIAGKVRVLAFDKTGTLTQPGLEFRGVHWAESQTGTKANLADQAPQYNDGRFFADQLAPDRVMQGMACCHAVSAAPVSLLGRAPPGEQQLLGNEVEVRMFAATGWRIKPGAPESGGGGALSRVTSPDGTMSLEIVRRYEFDHHRMTMSVVVRNPADATGSRFVVCKGAYERIAEICEQQTLPTDFDMASDAHAQRGNYVLGLAMRPLAEDEGPVQELTRDDVERDMTFVSLLLFRNVLKPDSGAAIAALKAGSVRPIMLTGDTAPTAAFIARECGMLQNASTKLLLGEVNDDRIVWRDLATGAGSGDSCKQPVLHTTEQARQMVVQSTQNVELAMTGACFGRLQQERGHLEQLLLHTRIFARVSPSQKTDIVSLHMALKLVTGMCGDGGNDCGALRRAHVGLALSDAEASLVSPFTAGSRSCMSAVDVLREGRGALATSFASYKFMMQYGTLFSFVKLLAYYYGVILSAVHYILIDIVLVIVLTFTLTLARPASALCTDRPTASLLGPTIVASVSRAFPSWNRSILTEIYRCHACSDHEIGDGNARAGVWSARDQRRHNRGCNCVHG
jgi:predicted P-type ATPase